MSAPAPVPEGCEARPPPLRRASAPLPGAFWGMHGPKKLLSEGTLGAAERRTGGSAAVRSGGSAKAAVCKRIRAPRPGDSSGPPAPSESCQTRPVAGATPALQAPIWGGKKNIYILNFHLLGVPLKCIYAERWLLSVFISFLFPPFFLFIYSFILFYILLFLALGGGRRLPGAARYPEPGAVPAAGAGGSGRCAPLPAYTKSPPSEGKFIW